MTLARVGVLLALAAGSARAESVEAPPADPACEALVARARALHAEERYRESLAVSQQAYACDPRPGLLFAMGQSAFNLGDYEAAESWYAKFLETRPAPEDEALVLQALAVTRERIAAARRAPVGEPADRIAWSLAIGGGALVLAGAGLYVVARQRAIDTSGRYADYDDRVASARRLRIGGIVCGGVGLALGGTATIRWLIGTPAARRTPSVAITPLGDGVAISFAGEL